MNAPNKPNSKSGGRVSTRSTTRAAAPKTPPKSPKKSPAKAPASPKKPANIPKNKIVCWRNSNAKLLCADKTKMKSKPKDTEKKK